MGKGGHRPADGLLDLSVPDADADGDAGADAGSGAAPRPTEAIPAPTSERALVRRFRLEVTAGPDAGLKMVSRGERVTIGTHRATDLRLADRTVSRFHCEIQLEGGKAVVRDLESRNGVTVDGVPVLAAPLRPGAVLGLGSSSIRFELGADHVAIPLSERDRFGLVLGRSPAMRAAFAVLERTAPTESIILLRGETGTGKDLVAESIHRESRRAAGPFVVVDCGALPPTLLESELFGHERGAFTGADRARPGAFEAAAGGTVFLDEIGELALELQPKLLRVLEAREVRRVGANRPLAIDVRLVAATTRNLRREVNAHRFRSDLYYRLAVVEIELPPLRRRKEDLPLLAEVLLAHLSPGDPGVASRLLTPALLEHLAQHGWPGNVRELRNYLERCLTFDEALLPFGDLAGAGPGAEPTVDPALPIRTARERWLAAFERRYLEALLARHGDNVTAAARAAGVNRMQLYRLLWRAGLR